MFANLIFTARVAAQRAAISLVGAILMLIGVGFLTVAAWIALAGAYGTLTAAVVIGCGYMGLGLIMVAIAALRRPIPPAVPAPAAAAPVGIAGLAGALVQGIGAGIVASSALQRPPPPPPPPPQNG